MNNLEYHRYLKITWNHLNRNSWKSCSISQRRFLTRQKTRFLNRNVTSAKEYFDKIYPGIYGEAWKNIKKAILSNNKYIAVINNFTDYEPLTKKIVDNGAFELGQFYNDTVKCYLEKRETFSEETKLLQQLNKNNEKESLVKFISDSNLAGDSYQPEEILCSHLSDEPNEDRKFDEYSIGSAVNYVQSKKFKGLEDWIEEKDVFENITKETDSDIGLKKMTLKEPLKWPGILKAYSFRLGDNSTFPEPYKWKKYNLYSHYLLNGSAILPVLALDLQPHDKVLDMCASPGGKSLIMLQTGLIGYLESSDVSASRTDSISRTTDLFFSKESFIRKIHNISQGNGKIVYRPHFFDKVLVDAPCLSDRTSMNMNEDNIFKNSRIGERLNMPKLQADLIHSALQSVKVGGSVVYSTSTLSPFQNDGAVFLALSRASKECDIECTVVNLNETVKQFNSVFKIGRDFGLRYGHIVLPAVNRNFGPMYFCKIIRDK